MAGLSRDLAALVAISDIARVSDASDLVDGHQVACRELGFALRDRGHRVLVGEDVDCLGPCSGRTVVWVPAQLGVLHGNALRVGCQRAEIPRVGAQHKAVRLSHGDNYCVHGRDM